MIATETTLNAADICELHWFSTRGGSVNDHFT
jgi:hypothetical protein